MQTLQPSCQCEFNGGIYGPTMKESDRLAAQSRLVELHDRCIAALMSFTPNSLLVLLESWEELDRDISYDDFPEFVRQHRWADQEVMVNFAERIKAIFYSGHNFVLENYYEITTVGSVVDLKAVS